MADHAIIEMQFDFLCEPAPNQAQYEKILALFKTKWVNGDPDSARDMVFWCDSNSVDEDHIRIGTNNYLNAQVGAAARTDKRLGADYLMSPIVVNGWYKRPGSKIHEWIGVLTLTSSDEQQTDVEWSFELTGESIQVKPICRVQFRRATSSHKVGP